jgi:predicted PurR-regulated permease PerM
MAMTELTPENVNAPANGPEAPDSPAKHDVYTNLEIIKRLLIWGLFFADLYAIRSFFFIAFFTFLFSYIALTLVGWLMNRLPADRNRPTVRRLVTLGIFIAVPLLLLVIGLIVVPKLVVQGQRMVGWASRLDPEAEVARLAERYVGNSEFRERYGGTYDTRYQKALADFRATGQTHVAAYLNFPSLEAWVEGSFAKQFADAHAARAKAHLMGEGPSSQDFERWFLSIKVPQLKVEAHNDSTNKGRTSHAVESLVRAAATASPEQLLQQARHDSAALTALQHEWVVSSVASELAAARHSSDYRDQLRQHYDELRKQSPSVLPYSFDEFLQLESARAKGPKEFGEAMRAMPGASHYGDAELRADFEAAKKHELFLTWWGSNSFAKVIRRPFESGGLFSDSSRLERYAESTLDIPLDLSTALLLSFFICIDFPALRRGVGRLRETWLRSVYDELAPALSNLGLLIGRAMQAQGLIAFCNAILIFIALTVFGVEHPALLASAVFVLCLVPTLGMIIAWALLAVVALIQPGGGIGLVLKVSAAVVAVVLLETFVFSPRILGKMMELHPVLIIALLPIAQYFFGVWGLILATPVTVFVIHEVIFGNTGKERLSKGEAAPMTAFASSQK